jgi:hypothetical protein
VRAELSGGNIVEDGLQLLFITDFAQRITQDLIGFRFGAS